MQVISNQQSGVHISIAQVSFDDYLNLQILICGF